MYERGLTALQGRWERTVLNKLAAVVMREASLATYYKSGTQRFVLGRKPRKVSFQWGWEPMGHANPKDYATAVGVLLDRKLTSPQRELSRMGVAPEEILNDWDRWNEMSMSRGLQCEHQKDETNEESNESV